METKTYMFNFVMTVTATDDAETLRDLLQDVRSYLEGPEHTERIQDKILSHYWRGGTDITQVDFTVNAIDITPNK